MSLRRSDLEGIRDHGMDIEGDGLELDLISLQLGNIENVVDELKQVLG